MKNSLIKLLIGTILRFRKKKEGHVERKHFLVVSTTGLGDTLWATPAIKALRETYPNSHISVLTSPIGNEVLSSSPHIQTRYVWNPKKWVSLLRKLRKEKIDTIFLFHASQRAVFLFCFLLNSHEIIGTEGLSKGLDVILSQKIEKKNIHEIARRLELVAAIGAHTLDPKLELFLTHADEEQASHFLKRHELPAYLPLVGLHPGAKDDFKQWSPSCFIALGKRLSQEIGCQIILTGNQDEIPLIEHIASQIPEAIVMRGELSVRSLGALMKHFAVFVTNDTGPMHVAFASHTPTVALFSPTHSTSCGPYPNPTHLTTIVEKPPTCTPCLRKKCGDPFCMLQISVEDVYRACCNYLNPSV